MPELTDSDRRLIARARQLAAVSGAAAIREYTGDSDPLGSCVAALAEAQHLLADLAGRLERLAGS